MASSEKTRPAWLDKDVMKNYRPVSVLPFVSKVLEKVVESRLENHLTRKGGTNSYTLSPVSKVQIYPTQCCSRYSKGVL
jgi:hypothetical protein